MGLIDLHYESKLKKLKSQNSFEKMALIYKKLPPIRYFIMNVLDCF